MIRAPTTRPTPHLIIPMSFQLAIPWRVALQHCPPPLHQPESILLQDRPNSGTSFTEGTNEWGCFENRNRLETAKQSTWGWVNDHENPWVNDCENPHLEAMDFRAGSHRPFRRNCQRDGSRRLSDPRYEERTCFFPASILRAIAWPITMITFVIASPYSAYSPVMFSELSGSRAPCNLIFEAATSISPRSAVVSSTPVAPRFSSRRSRFVVPGIGTIHGF